MSIPISRQRLVTALMSLLDAAQKNEYDRQDAVLLSYHAREVKWNPYEPARSPGHDQDWERSKAAFVREVLWERDGLLRLQVHQAEGRTHMTHTVERYLPSRVLTPTERTTLTE